MLDNLSGATRLHFIVGDPIAQVKSPFGVTQAFEQAGLNALCVPAHVSPKDLGAWFAGVTASRNADGIIVTVPHKFDASAYCASKSERAEFLGAVNTLRRNPDGSWHGDMFDGLGYVQAIASKAYDLKAKKALLVGAGGAGSAISHSLVLAGVSELAIYDPDSVRAQSLIQRLDALGLAKVYAGSTDPQGFDVLINASPMGMAPGDPMPFAVEFIKASMFVGCVITAPAISPLIAAAQSVGCKTTTGADMFAQVRNLMVQFLLGR
jgi:shikimate dehydrogenase